MTDSGRLTARPGSSPHAAVVTDGGITVRDGEVWHVRKETVDPRQTGEARLERNAFTE